jgi:hypothetical protein
MTRRPSPAPLAAPAARLLADFRQGPLEVNLVEQ